MKPNRVYGLSRSRDKKGNIVKRNLNSVVNTIHTLVGCGWDTMDVIIVEVYDWQNYSNWESYPVPKKI